MGGVRILAGALALASAMDAAAVAAAPRDTPQCLHDARRVPRVWSWDRWVREFGVRHEASATGVAIEDPKAFRFYHFGKAGRTPLVLLMGHTSSMMQWDPAFLYGLKQCFDVYLFDNLGVGWSAFTSDADTKLAAMTWTDMATFVNRAVEGIRTSRHCRSSRRRCGLVGRTPTGMGFAMGGRVVVSAASLEPSAWDGLINLGGNLMDGDDGNVGPNPLMVDELEGYDLTAAYVPFLVAADPWGTLLHDAAELAFAESAFRIAPYYYDARNADGRLTVAQKDAQAAAVAEQPVIAPSAVTNPVFNPYGLQDDQNGCYPASGDDYARACTDTTGQVCTDVSCTTRVARPTCTTDDGESGCLWGLSPKSDAKDAYDGLPNARWYCLRGYVGAHAFVYQSRTTLLADVVRFASGRRDRIGCELPAVR
jgi:pimeloyl-ACP methyl ester carboxylesterase